MSPLMLYINRNERMNLLSTLASYRTAALDQVTYEANMNIWKKIRINGFSFRDVSDVNLK